MTSKSNEIPRRTDLLLSRRAPAAVAAAILAATTVFPSAALSADPGDYSENGGDTQLVPTDFDPGEATDEATQGVGQSQVSTIGSGVSSTGSAEKPVQDASSQTAV